MKMVLELNADQETFVVIALMDAARMAWNASMHGQLDPEPCEEHGEECNKFWNNELSTAVSVLEQFPSGVMACWRESLSASPYQDEEDHA
jgi:hypothetical protein